jgi:hypothetical protein
MVAEFASLYAVINDQITYLHNRAKELGLPFDAASGDASNMLYTLLGHTGACHPRSVIWHGGLGKYCSYIYHRHFLGCEPDRPPRGDRFAVSG